MGSIIKGCDREQHKHWAFTASSLVLDIFFCIVQYSGCRYSSSGTIWQWTEKPRSAYSLSYLSDRAGGGLPNASQLRSPANGHQWCTWSYLCIIKNVNWPSNIWRCSSKDDKSMLTTLGFSGISMTAHEKEDPVYPVLLDTPICLAFCTCQLLKLNVFLILTHWLS